MHRVYRGRGWVAYSRFTPSKKSPSLTFPIVDRYEDFNRKVQSRKCKQTFRVAQCIVKPSHLS